MNTSHTSSDLLRLSVLAEVTTLSRYNLNVVACAIVPLFNYKEDITVVCASWGTMVRFWAASGQLVCECRLVWDSNHKSVNVCFYRTEMTCLTAANIVRSVNICLRNNDLLS